MNLIELKRLNKTQFCEILFWYRKKLKETYSTNEKEKYEPVKKQYELANKIYHERFSQKQLQVD